MSSRKRVPKMAAIGMFICPECGKYSASLMVKKTEEINYCYCTKCKSYYLQGDFRLVEKVVPAVDCEDCQFTVTLTEDNEMYGDRKKYICPKCLQTIAEKEESTSER